MNSPKITALLFMILCFPIAAISQSYYNDISYSQKKGFFIEDFNNNNKNWPYIRTGDYWTGRISGGYLYWANKRTTPLMIEKDIKYFDSNRDFEIEVRASLVTGAQANLVKFSWGRESSKIDNFYSFGFTNEGKYYIGQHTSSAKWKAFKSYVYSSYLNKSAYNKLTLRKMNGKYYFFINEKFVHSMPFKPFFGNTFTISAPKNSTIKVDFVKYSYIEKKKEVVNYPPKLKITEPDITRGFQVVKAKMVKVSGIATDANGVYEVTANGIEANLQANGFFTVNVPLAVGNNTVTVVATDTRMKKTTKTFKVDRQGTSAGTIATGNTTGGGVGSFNPNEKRVALIVGNSNYTGAAHLGVNPINDAKDMASTLRSIGFDVILKTDADFNSLNNAIREFGRKNTDADVALFYFAGHGMQINHVNYLVPTSVNIQNKNDVDFECINVSKVQRIMETSNAKRLNLIVLDACRNNPFRSWSRGGETGLADMTPPSGTLIAFATSPGSTASNGTGRNGLYTGELVKQLKKPQRIVDVFINTRVEVEKKSGGRQSPWELARLRGMYYLLK